jgi:hypothetical protein
VNASATPELYFVFGTAGAMTERETDEGSLCLTHRRWLCESAVWLAHGSLRRDYESGHTCKRPSPNILLLVSPLYPAACLIFHTMTKPT